MIERSWPRIERGGRFLCVWPEPWSMVSKVMMMLVINIDNSVEVHFVDYLIKCCDTQTNFGLI